MEKKPINVWRIMLFTAIPFFFVMAFICAGAGGLGTGRRSDNIVSRGEIGRIEIPGEATVWVVINEKAMEEKHAFSRAKNERGIQQMITQGRLFVCEANTEVSVIDPGFMSSTIRIMEGRHAGRTGIIENEFLHK